MEEGLQVGSGESMETLDKGVIHVPVGSELSLCRPKQYAISDFRILRLLNFPFTTSDCGWQWLLYRVRWSVKRIIILSFSQLMDISGCFYVRAVMKMAAKAMSICIHTFVWAEFAFVLSEYQGDLLSHIINLFNAIRKCHACFQSGFTISHSPECLRVLFPTSSPMLTIFYGLFVEMSSHSYSLGWPWVHGSPLAPSFPSTGTIDMSHHSWSPFTSKYTLSLTYNGVTSRSTHHKLKILWVKCISYT